MAPPKRRGGRVTPKGTRPGETRGRVERGAGAPPPADDGPPHARAASSRYTPPMPKAQLESPRWVPILMFTLLIAGALVIMVNYIAGGVSNWYLILGLLLILGGIITATQYR